MWAKACSKRGRNWLWSPSSRFGILPGEKAEASILESTSVVVFCFIFYSFNCLAALRPANLQDSRQTAKLVSTVLQSPEFLFATNQNSASENGLFALSFFAN